MDTHPMMRSVSITGYRGFKQFEMHGLGRVNLLVGKNNSGKSSALEALYLLGAGGDPEVLWSICESRGEFVESDETGASGNEINVRHIFWGHPTTIGDELRIAGDRRLLTLEIARGARPDPQEAAAPIRPYLGASLHFGDTKVSEWAARVSRDFGLSEATLDAVNPLGVPPRMQTRYVSTASSAARELATKWADMSLTDGEDRVMRALQIVTPGIERLALSNPPFKRKSRHLGFQLFTRSGFKIRVSGIDKPIPIGSLGEGTWRLLALAINISEAKDGLLLVDEIDTGLHHTAMVDMWRMVTETAKALNVQVFATTHSKDCVDALAAVCGKGGTDISMQRIEADKTSAVAYSEGEIIALARSGIESR